MQPSSRSHHVGVLEQKTTASPVAPLRCKELGRDCFFRRWQGRPGRVGTEYSARSSSVACWLLVVRPAWNIRTFCTASYVACMKCLTLPPQLRKSSSVCRARCYALVASGKATNHASRTVQMFPCVGFSAVAVLVKGPSHRHAGRVFRRVSCSLEGLMQYGNWHCEVVQRR